MVSSSKRDGVFIIALAGKLMGDDTNDFYQVIGQAATENIKSVVLDLKDVDWINSTGLGMIIAGSARVRDMGGTLKLAQPNDSISKVLTLNRLHQIFEIHPTIEAAIASFK
ncbi:STAS domain-containing protein [bacterium]|nr:STAS domain-containing protein [bacterium]MBU1983484.1 STAS domain-containing protein [bacterium]